MFSHCASGVKCAWRDGNLQWEGERWLQVLGAVFCSQDSGIATQAVTPASKEETLCTLFSLGSRFQYLCALTNSVFVRSWLPSLPSRRDIAPPLPPRTSEDLPGVLQQSYYSYLSHLHSGGKQQSPHIWTRVQSPKRLPKEEEAQKENCGDHQKPSVAQQIKGFLAAKQV